MATFEAPDQALGDDEVDRGGDFVVEDTEVAEGGDGGHGVTSVETAEKQVAGVGDVDGNARRLVKLYQKLSAGRFVALGTNREA